MYLVSLAPRASTEYKYIRAGAREEIPAFIVCGFGISFRGQSDMRCVQCGCGKCGIKFWTSVGSLSGSVLRLCVPMVVMINQFSEIYYKPDH